MCPSDAGGETGSNTEVATRKSDTMDTRHGPVWTRGSDPATLPEGMCLLGYFCSIIIIRLYFDDATCRFKKKKREIEKSKSPVHVIRLLPIQIKSRSTKKLGGRQCKRDLCEISHMFKPLVVNPEF